MFHVKHYKKNKCGKLYWIKKKIIKKEKLNNLYKINYVSRKTLKTKKANLNKNNNQFDKNKINN